MKNETRVALLIYDYDDSFDKLTSFLRLTPSLLQEEEKGQVRRWELSSGLPLDEDAETHLESLLQTLQPRAKEVYEIAQKYRCVIAVGIRYYEFNPEIALTPEVLRSLSDLGVKLWLDLYNMWDGKSDRDYHDTNPDISKL